MDEGIKINKGLNDTAAQLTQAAANGGGTVGGTYTDPNTQNTARKSYDNTAAINALYDAQRQAKASELEAAYNQNRSNLEAARDQLANSYQTQRNAANVDWERQRRNFLESANMNGINTGAGAQARLAMKGANLRTMGQLGAAQAQAETDAQRQLNDLYANYQSNLIAANANAEAQRAAAQIDELRQQYNRDADQAQALAQYGDFSGYANLYGQEAADNMRQMWITQNPDVAYTTGQITQGQWQNLKAGLPMNQGLNPDGSGVGGGAGNMDVDAYWFGDHTGGSGGVGGGGFGEALTSLVNGGGDGRTSQAQADAIAMAQIESMAQQGQLTPAEHDFIVSNW